MKKYFPGYPDLPSIKPPKADIRAHPVTRLKRDSEPNAMNTKLEADILRIILDKISGTYVRPIGSESKVIS